MKYESIRIDTGQQDLQMLIDVAVFNGDFASHVFCAQPKQRFRYAVTDDGDAAGLRGLQAKSSCRNYLF